MISSEEIRIRIKQLAFSIFNDYYINKNIKTINFIYILDGAFIFAADLCRELYRKGMSLNIGSLTMKTYVGTESVKNPIINPLLNYSLEGKDVLVVEDILDTGNTINHLEIILSGQKPKSIEYCCLLKKNHNRCILHSNIDIKYIGFTIPDDFVIGYGLDYNGLYREIPYIKEYKYFKVIINESL